MLYAQKLQQPDPKLLHPADHNKYHDPLVLGLRCLEHILCSRRSNAGRQDEPEVFKQAMYRAMAAAGVTTAPMQLPPSAPISEIWKDDEYIYRIL
jgi:hypothetical protein